MMSAFRWQATSRQRPRAAWLRAMWPLLVAMMTGAPLVAAEYYVSASGDDRNPAAGPTRPWRTIAKVNSFAFAPGDVIRFERGGTWREQLDPRSGSEKGSITYTAYGEGPKPLLLGSVEKNRPSDWQQAGPSLWRAGPFPCDVGNIVFNNGQLCGIKVWRDSDVNAPHKFWYDAKGGTILLYGQRCPAEIYQDTECALTRHIISQGGKSYVVYDGLHLAYGAAHGVGGGGTHHIVVRNCDLCFIGGGHQYTTPSGHHVRYGNGIEFWDGAHDNLVEHCRIWDIYDAGFTNQGGSKNSQYNITYRKNVIWNCEYSFEYWNRPETSTTHDIYFEDNLCFNAGHGWSNAQRPWHAGVHLMFFSNSAQTRRFFVRRNVFHAAKHSTINLDAAHWNGLEELTLDENLYCQPADTLLVGWSATTYKPDALAAYQQRTGKDARSVLVTLKSLAASPARMELRVGQARPLKVTATYSNGIAVDVTNVSSFTSSAGTVALVDAEGLVCASQPGKAAITAAFEGLTAATSILVTPRAALAPDL